MITVRPATPDDTAAIEALMAPEITRGTVLPRSVNTDDFLLAFEGARLVGTVALTPQSSRIIELGSLVSTVAGVGLGQRLVEAAMVWAEIKGFDVVMALTAIPGFFERAGFRGASHAPWITARRKLAMPHPLPLIPCADAVEASRAKSTTCVDCPRLHACSQTMLLRPIPARQRRRA